MLEQSPAPVIFWVASRQELRKSWKSRALEIAVLGLQSCSLECSHPEQASEEIDLGRESLVSWE
jgi:hypothetical protein